MQVTVGSDDDQAWRHHLSDAHAEDERPPALVAAVEHRAVLQPPRVVRLHGHDRSGRDYRKLDRLLMIWVLHHLINNGWRTIA